MTSIKFRALTHNDHKLFFEALGEYGKDFQNIQQYMSQKAGKTIKQSTSEQAKLSENPEKREDDKKREQIRNFYNKLYTKLSQLIGKLDDRVEKVNQELYLLINYGEIWKKQHGFKFNNKTKKLLEELVYQGYTTLRYKNKNVRLRTPPCKALKKINEIGVDEKVKVVTTRELPKDVEVEFHPATNRDWLKVQSMSQNPRVRARLSIQKRLSHILEFLENKWNVSQDKLNRTVDVWLKVPHNNQQSAEEPSANQPSSTNHLINNNSSLRMDLLTDARSDNLNPGNLNQRLRLKPSPQHELKEVNITRVIPDNHLDLSLNAYIKRVRESNPKYSQSSGSKDSQLVQQSNIDDIVENCEHSQGPPRFPISLTTPDSSILLERSCTSDQPSIAQARKHLNILQSLAGTLEGCENSRTACEDTQDRSLLAPLRSYQSKTDRASGLKSNECDLSGLQDYKTVQNFANSQIPALYDEDAALPVPCTLNASTEKKSDLPHPSSGDSQNSKSVDFSIPKNVTLGDYFKMTGRADSDEANDAFPLREDIDNCEGRNDQVNKAQAGNTKDQPKESTSYKSQNHHLEIEKLAAGWTKLDESDMAIGELYLGFGCPEKIILEYGFEPILPDNEQLVEVIPDKSDKIESNTIEAKKIRDPLRDYQLAFKLLTAASLSLAHIVRQKQELQLKSLAPNTNPQSCSRFKRRKGSGQNQTMTLHDIEATNQIKECLGQLQPTRLSGYRKAR